MRALTILDEVWADVADAAQWFDDTGGRELGDRFVAKFYSYWPVIQRDADTFRMVYKQFRRVLIKSFPYALYFRVHEDRVIVALLWHTARNPTDLTEALDERGY